LILGFCVGSLLNDVLLVIPKRDMTLAKIQWADSKCKAKLDEFNSTERATKRRRLSRDENKEASDQADVEDSAPLAPPRGAVGISVQGWSVDHSACITVAPDGKIIFPTTEQMIYRIPYSSHSSFRELLDFVSRIRPKKIVPLEKGSFVTSVDFLINSA
jgi:hypothetical protein